ncbi:Conserved_hypothetical protein [Hexamita inflata]|uniref:Uncharacterized protein n=1 Tax=Hexamita inflata TaxID=28002 RepID=A0AA86TYU1_9EUKA|nr:Conserved hypothetical protein [Hexamita inflata]
MEDFQKLRRRVLDFIVLQSKQKFDPREQIQIENEIRSDATQLIKTYSKQDFNEIYNGNIVCLNGIFQINLNFITRVKQELAKLSDEFQDKSITSNQIIIEKNAEKSAMNESAQKSQAIQQKQETPTTQMRSSLLKLKSSQQLDNIQQLQNKVQVIKAQVAEQETMNVDIEQKIKSQDDEIIVLQLELQQSLAKLKAARDIHNQLSNSITKLSETENNYRKCLSFVSQHLKDSEQLLQSENFQKFYDAEIKQISSDQNIIEKKIEEKELEKPKELKNYANIVSAYAQKAIKTQDDKSEQEAKKIIKKPTKIQQLIETKPLQETDDLSLSKTKVIPKEAEQQQKVISKKKPEIKPTKTPINQFTQKGKTQQKQLAMVSQQDIEALLNDTCTQQTHNTQQTPQSQITQNSEKPSVLQSQPKSTPKNILKQTPAKPSEQQKPDVKSDVKLSQTSLNKSPNKMVLSPNALNPQIQLQSDNSILADFQSPNQPQQQIKSEVSAENLDPLAEARKIAMQRVHEYNLKEKERNQQKTTLKEELLKKRDQRLEEFKKKPKTTTQNHLVYHVDEEIEQKPDPNLFKQEQKMKALENLRLAKQMGKGYDISTIENKVVENIEYDNDLACDLDRILDEIDQDLFG